MSEHTTIWYLETQRGQKWVVGHNCDLIEEHRAIGEGDRWFYDVVIHEDKVNLRIFDPVEVGFDKGKPNA